MRVKTWVTFDQEVDVEISATDFLESLPYGPEREMTIIQGLNALAHFLRGIPSKDIEQMPIQRRQVVYTFLQEQAERFGTGAEREEQTAIEGGGG